MVAIQTQTMSPQRKKFMDLAEQVAEWKTEYNGMNSPKQSDLKDKVKAIHNHLCKTLDAGNTWLEGYEGPYNNGTTTVRGPIQSNWREL